MIYLGKQNNIWLLLCFGLFQELLQVFHLVKRMLNSLITSVVERVWPVPLNSHFNFNPNLTLTLTLTLVLTQNSYLTLTLSY